MKVLIVGNRGGTNIGGCFERSAPELSVEARLAESRRASEAPVWLRRFNWWLRGKRPTRLRSFCREVLRECEEWRPDCLVATGISPLDEGALRVLRREGIVTANYLTDDPWNPAHRAPWFLKALPLYGHVFSPRTANLQDLRQAGCPRVFYLPFAYAPELHFPEESATPEGEAAFSADLVFVGSGDRDRVPYIVGALRSGVKVLLYGSFWDRFRETRDCSRGQADPQTMRKAIRGAKVALCLVRRANRDGHSMRTFEIPAIGTCMLAEETEEHRQIFGREGESVLYFRSVKEMQGKLEFLLKNEEERRRLAETARARIVSGGNTYADRLKTMLGTILGGRL